jgi:hypothetical protein
VHVGARHLHVHLGHVLGILDVTRQAQCGGAGGCGAFQQPQVDVDGDEPVLKLDHGAGIRQPLPFEPFEGRFEHVGGLAQLAAVALDPRLRHERRHSRGHRLVIQHVDG